MFVFYIQHNVHCLKNFPYTLYYIKIGICHNPRDYIKRQEIAVGNAILCMQYVTVCMFVMSGWSL